MPPAALRPVVICRTMAARQPVQQTYCDQTDHEGRRTRSRRVNAISRQSILAHASLSCPLSLKSSPRPLSQQLLSRLLRALPKNTVVHLDSHVICERPLRPSIAIQIMQHDITATISTSIQEESDFSHSIAVSAMFSYTSMPDIARYLPCYH